jgi:hypothetical protein
VTPTFRITKPCIDAEAQVCRGRDRISDAAAVSSGGEELAKDRCVRRNACRLHPKLALAASLSLNTGYSFAEERKMRGREILFPATGNIGVRLQS